MEAQNIGNEIKVIDITRKIEIKEVKPKINPDYLTDEADLVLIEEEKYLEDFDRAKGYNKKMEVIIKELERLKEELGPNYVDEGKYFKERKLEEKKIEGSKTK